MISVIMGVYNVKDKEMAELSINSILNQTYDDFEFIICDDGSTNDTISIIEDITKGDKRIKLIANDKNYGLAYSLNHCLKYARGEYIARMDIDDCSFPDRFEKQIKYLEEHKELSFCGTLSELFDSEGVWGKRILKEYPQKRNFLFGSCIIHATVMYRKEALLCAGGYAVKWYTKRAEDYELFMRMYSLELKAGNIQECLYKIREDKDAFARRKYKYRFQEAYVRMIGFWRLRLYPIGAIYVLKPLIVGLIPQKILKIFRNEKINEGKCYEER